MGGTVEHRFDETEDGLAHGRILRLEVPHLLEYEWRFPGEPDSAVCFELRAEGDRTVITLTHRMLGVGHAAGYGAGWHAHLDRARGGVTGGSLSWDERFGELIGGYQTRFTPPSPATTSTGTPGCRRRLPRGDDHHRADRRRRAPRPTIAPTAMMTSGSERTIAAGPVPSRSDSARTLDDELDPRPDGMISTRPVTDSPNWG